jgi:hypothetical protein
LVRALQTTLPPPPGASDGAEAEEAAAAAAAEDAADGVVSFSLRSPKPRAPAPSPSRAKQAGAALPGAYGTLGAGGGGGDSGSNPAPDRSGQALVFVNDFATAEQVAGALEDLGAFCCQSVWLQAAAR